MPDFCIYNSNILLNIYLYGSSYLEPVAFNLNEACGSRRSIIAIGPVKPAVLMALGRFCMGVGDLVKYLGWNGGERQKSRG